MATIGCAIRCDVVDQTCKLIRKGWDSSDAAWDAIRYWTTSTTCAAFEGALDALAEGDAS
jgi:hypothetical protein